MQHVPSLGSLDLLTLVSQLESIAQRFHVRILAFHQFESIGYNANWPRMGTPSLACFEAEMKIARVSLIQTEGVNGSFGIGFRVSSQPFF